MFWTRDKVHWTKIRVLADCVIRGRLYALVKELDEDVEMCRATQSWGNTAVAVDRYIQRMRDVGLGGFLPSIMPPVTFTLELRPAVKRKVDVSYPQSHLLSRVWEELT